MLRGLRDYVRKNGFSKVVLGLSGGIDSAIVAAIAVDALGPEDVHCIMLPYRYTSSDSLRDAEDCARRLHLRYDTVPIGRPVDAALEELAPVFGNAPPDLTEENIQSRMRGLVLMAISNKSGAMLLTTGNKSEMAVGYATIYGDMNGGQSDQGDLFKMEGLQTRRLAQFAHPAGHALPEGRRHPAEAIIDKAPTAELRPNQTDQDLLPPYPILDEVLTGMIEDELSIAEIVARGEGRFDRALVQRIERLVLLAEYKRRQAAPGVKMTSKAFGIGRKYPITNGYRDESDVVTVREPAADAAGRRVTVVRYAPSPTGRLHLGNARPALLNWLFALRTGGDYILRYDDTDTARSTDEFARGIEGDLAWLGIAPALRIRQSDRMALYHAARERLIAAGRLYPAYETEDELEIKRGRARLLGKPPIYDRAALALTDEQKRAYDAEGRKPHWRFRLDGRPVHFADLIKGPQTVNTASMSDPVLVRGDGSYLYTLTSVVDDIDLAVTHVIRGEDHVSNTGTQIEIFEALGGTVPEFAHHNLLTGAEGEGLSKRLGSLSLSDLRAEGFEAMAVALVATLTGTSLPVEPYPTSATLAGKASICR